MSSRISTRSTLSEPFRPPIERPERPSEAAIMAAIEFMYRLPEGMGHELLADSAEQRLDILAQAEEFIFHLRRLEKGEISNIPLPTDIPELGSFYSYQQHQPRYLIERYDNA